MKTLIIYDSLYGNTEKIAKAIHQVLPGKSRIMPIKKVKYEDLPGNSLLIFGSPTHGGMPKAEIHEFISNIPDELLKGIKIAAYDTRFALSEHGLGLRLLMSVINFASPKMTKVLVAKGGIAISQGIGFIVSDKKGPLNKGEIERAQNWAIQLFTN